MSNDHREPRRFAEYQMAGDGVLQEAMQRVTPDTYCIKDTRSAEEVDAATALSHRILQMQKLNVQLEEQQEAVNVTCGVKALDASTEPQTSQPQKKKKVPWKRKACTIIHDLATCRLRQSRTCSNHLSTGHARS